MHNSTLSFRLSQDKNFLTSLETAIAIRYILFSGQRFGDMDSVSVSLFGLRRANPEKWRQLFWFQTGLLLGESSKSRFDLFEPSVNQRDIERQFTEWEKRGATPWWSQMIQSRPFVGLIVTDSTEMEDVSEHDPRFYLYHGMLLERVKAHTTMLEEMAEKDHALFEKREAIRLLRRRLIGFVKQTHEAHMSRVRKKS